MAASARAPIRTLRVVLGVLFFASAILKLLSLDDPRFQGSGVWHLARGNQDLLAIGFCLEGAAGLALLLGLGTRAVAGVLAAALLTATAWLKIAEAQRGESFSTCGCFGSPSVEHSLLMPSWELQTGLFVFALLCVSVLHARTGLSPGAD